ncbi:SH3 domain-containing RING finger protein 3 isoform X2 [Orussus abietinus]|uniref:SH3 domain-containing RING finger protein 3 isoform X2 n=1 Tax=Orussus abietinus TaxID=222816 RepID=UPI000C715AFA|nr:SH3 domain-containing RING finger protein 3 isoform X2 [Orussus abietinus]
MDEGMLDDLLECSVCLERLDTSSKVLPCQHTFCKKCLEDIANTHRELRCPECRILVEVKIDDLPPNVLLMRILEGMRNAGPRNGKNSTRTNATPRRPFAGHQVAPVPINTSIAPIVAPDSTVRHADSSAKLTRSHPQPYGRAIYDYVSKVPGDLNFRKGDIITLRKKIDNNWYFGESSSSHGVFPLSYIQVVTPLPPHIPQCKALYDFRMTNDEEEGCLTFNKGEVISVIRRVDENWAEGKLLDRIGIFPLAFVELNGVARALMKLSANAQPGPSRVAPPTPTNEETTPLIPTDHSRNVQTTSHPRPQPAPTSTLPVSDSNSTLSSGGSSTTTTTPNTPNSSSTSSSSSTAPSSPGSPATSPMAVGTRQSVKRHSFTANTRHHSHSHSHHRHSAEILSPAVDALIAGNGSTNGNGTGNGAGSNEHFALAVLTSPDPTEYSLRHRRSGSSDQVLAQSLSTSVVNTASTTSNSCHLPAAYIALYPYKPQKADELELRKGGIYMVTERCQDGWFKGTSNRTQKCGVFPGNYVTPAKCQRGACRTASSGSVPSQQGAALASVQVSAGERLHASCTRTNKSGPSLQQPFNLHSLPPPELPPRSASPSPVSSSTWLNKSQSPPRGGEQSMNATGTTPTTSSSAATTVIGRTHATVSPPTVASPGSQAAVAPILPSTPDVHREPSRSPSSTARMSSNAPMSLPTASTVAPLINVRSAEKPKEKKDHKGVSLMRRLTNIKKSKSPPPATYSMDNPVFDDGNSIGTSNPVHMRSGSCPSQLLQMGPAQEINNPVHNQQRLHLGSGQGLTHAVISERAKQKEKYSLPVSQCVFTQRPGDPTTATNPTGSSHHRKSNSLDAGMGKHIKQHQFSSRERERVYRFRCIVPYPPNSEFELELRVGDIIYVHKKRDDGWYKGTQERTGRTGLFPASFVEAF